MVNRFRSAVYQPNQDHSQSHQDELLDELLDEDELLEDDELLELAGGLLTVTVCTLLVWLPAVSVAVTVIWALAPAGRLLRLLLPVQLPLE